MDIILFLIAAPIINLFILIIAACCGEGRSSYSSDVTPTVMSPENHSAPVTSEGYKDDRDIADMFDTRLTNITKNPWKGIL